MRKHPVRIVVWALAFIAVTLLSEEPAKPAEKPASAGGEIQVEAEFVPRGGGAAKTLTSATGSWPLPAGTYDVKSFSLKRTVDDRVCVLKGTTVPTKYQRMDVTNVEPLDMKLGPPLTLSVDVEARKNSAKLRVWLTGKEGETYVPGLMQGQPPTASVKYKISSADGARVLGVGSMDCGSDGVCATTWKAPDDFKGNCKVELDTDLTGFEFKKPEKGFAIDYVGTAEDLAAAEAKEAAKTGAVTAAAAAAIPQVEVEFVSSGQSKTLTSSTGSFELPRSVWDVKTFYLKKTVDGTNYALKGLSPSPKFFKLDTSDGLPVEMKFGPPLTLSKSVTKKKNKVDISIALSGQEGETYLPGLVQGTRASISMKYKIVDESDKVMANGQVQNRADGSSGCSWAVPGNFKGKYKVDIEIDLKVFEVRQDDQWFMIE